MKCFNVKWVILLLLFSAVFLFGSMAIGLGEHQIIKINESIDAMSMPGGQLPFTLFLAPIINEATSGVTANDLPSSPNSAIDKVNIVQSTPKSATGSVESPRQEPTGAPSPTMIPSAIPATGDALTPEQWNEYKEYRSSYPLVPRVSSMDAFIQGKRCEKASSLFKGIYGVSPDGGTAWYYANMVDNAKLNDQVSWDRVRNEMINDKNYITILKKNDGTPIARCSKA